MSDMGKKEGAEPQTPSPEQDAAGTEEGKGTFEKATDASQQALNDLGDAVDDLVAEAPDLWDKTKKAAGGVADEVKEKGPGIWDQMKGLASDAAKRFDEGFKGESSDAPKPEEEDAGAPTSAEDEQTDDRA